LSFFLFYEIKEQEGGTGPVGDIVGSGGSGEEVRKGHGSVSIAQLCSHVCKWKTIPVETILGMEGGAEKG
jgi:hypothetical protein